MQNTFFRFALSVLFVLSILGKLNAQTVEGIVSDAKGEPMPFMTVYKEGSTNGTSTNEKGFYSLRLSPGEHLIIFRFVGYRTEQRKVTLRAGEKLELNIKMQAQDMLMSQVEVVAGEKDPAYSMIRKAQERRKFYLTQADKYKTQVYVKNIQRIEEMPEKILGEKVVIEELGPDRKGVVYLSESVSDIYVKRPNKLKEVMISSRVSGASEAYSWNSVAGFIVDFYEKTFDIGLTPRPLISPIAPGAMLYYKYSWEGAFTENGITIHKIKLIPKASGAPLYKGMIYLQEGTWRIHSADVYLDKTSGIEFLSKLRMKQVYTPVRPDLWMLRNQTISLAYDVGFMNVRIKGNGSATGVFSKYKIGSYKPTPLEWSETDDEIFSENTEKLPELNLGKTNIPQLSKEEKKTLQKGKENEIDQDQETTDVKEAFVKLDSLDFDDNFFNAEVLKVEEGAKKRDSTYWAAVRPVPLTEEEVKDYRVKDSMEVIRESRAFRDSVDSISNAFKVMDLLFGYNYSNSYTNTNWNFSSILEGFQFNTVEGPVLNLGLGWSRRNKDTRRRHSLSGTLRYGFDSEKFYAKATYYRRFDPVKGTFFRARAGRFIMPFGGNNMMPPFWNTLYTTLMEQNFLKFYQEAYASVFGGTEIFNGLVLSTGLRFGDRTPLFNAKELTPLFIDRPNREFTGNNPLDPNSEDAVFEQHRALTFNAVIRIRFGQKYLSYPDRRLRMGSESPTVYLRYKKGISGVAQSRTDFDFLEVSVSDEMNLGIFGESVYNIAAGTFLSSRDIPFMDARHFRTSEILFAPTGTRSFFAMPYYDYSTTKAYAELHYEHHFNGFLLNKIPFIKKLKWQAVGGIHTLFSEEHGSYSELTAGV